MGLSGAQQNRGAWISGSESGCPPVAAVHDPSKCRHYNRDFDADCCAGSDRSSYPGECADGFVRAELGACGQGHPWCDANGCSSYECTARRVRGTGTVTIPFYAADAVAIMIRGK